MRSFTLGLFGILLIGCQDPDAVPRSVIQGFGDTAKVDLAVLRRLRVIERKLKITPPLADTADLDALEKGLEQARKLKR